MTKWSSTAGEQKPGPTRPTDTVPCVACREPIQRGAHVCVHCDTRQDWTRHLGRWSTSLTAILALVPLWTGAVSLYRIAFGQHQAEVQLEALTCDTRFVLVAVTNAGDRPGILVRSSVAVNIGGKDAGESISLLPTEEHSLVRPGEAFVLKLEPRVEGVPSTLPSPQDGGACQYHVSVTVSGFDGTSSKRIVACDCPRPSART